MHEDAFLSRLHADIEARVQAIRADRPEWLCSKGCDNCCRHLAAIPWLTEAEWDLLREGLTALPSQRLEEINREVIALTGRDKKATGPVVCPLLDRRTGACPAYAKRPVACRTYGFYVQRDRGLYCHEIESRVADGTLADVVWGNHDAIDQCLATLGETRPLTEWLASRESAEAADL